MSDVRVLNGGSLVSRRIRIDRYSTTQEDLIESIREACTDLENARFETVVEDGPHSAYERYYLEVYGTPTGELARQVTPEHDHQPSQHRDGKPPWCRACGLTDTYEVPKSRFEKES